MLKGYYRDDAFEAGCDEAGRGCLAGPVVAAAVILPYGYENSLLKDSKKLSPPGRERLRIQVENDAVALGIGVVSSHDIDRINILNASILAMHRALDRLPVTPRHIIADGNRFSSYKGIPHTCIVKGDALYMSIAAASILAKTYRDGLMRELHLDFPVYGWDSNKGYPTVKHAAALREHGACPHHRKSFRLKPVQTKIELMV
ncbi:MAG: ribonuclease HII [Marinilabiliales bacterium]|nr:MAG: ribonuclease HII [Marinilabiliales bacterium]